MKTLGTKFTAATTLLIQGVKGKVDDAGNVNPVTEGALKDFTAHFQQLLQ
jgi:hypothetical protein